MSPRKQPVSKKLFWGVGPTRSDSSVWSSDDMPCWKKLRFKIKTNDFWPRISKFCGDQWVLHKRGGLTKGTTFGQKTTMYAPNKRFGQNLPERPIWERIQNGKWKGLLTFFCWFWTLERTPPCEKQDIFSSDPSWQPKAIKGRKKWFKPLHIHNQEKLFSGGKPKNRKEAFFAPPPASNRVVRLA